MSLPHPATPLCVGLALAAAGAGAHLPPFEADLGRQEVRGEVVRAPYATVTSYFGYIAPGARPDAEQDARKTFYLYVWMPQESPEVGVRVVSPVRGWARPRPEVDFSDPSFAANKDSDVYFDPFVRIERCLAGINPEDITKPCPQWVELGENDDSEELPAQPSGRRHNALVRIGTSRTDPLKALVRGVYRVALTQAKVGDVHGTYVLQWGTPGLLAGVGIARDLPQLATFAHAAAKVRLATERPAHESAEKPHAVPARGG